MCITETYLFHQTLGSEVEAFALDRISEDLEEKLDRATDDQLTNWLLTQGITQLEIDACEEQGISLRSLVEDQVAYGNAFEILD